MRTTRPAGALVTTLLAVVAALLLASPAGAATAHPAQYDGDFTVSVKATELAQGTTQTVSIRNGTPFEVFTITLDDGTVLGTYTADANGNVTFDIDTGPLVLGEHLVRVTGGGVTKTVSFDVVAAQGGVVPPVAGATAPGGTPPAVGSSGSGAVPVAAAPGTRTIGGLAFTGANAVVPLLVLGAVLVLAGVAAVLASLRKQRHRLS